MSATQKSGWNKLLDLFLSEKGGPTFGEAVYYFEDEVKTTRFIHGSKAIRDVFVGWLDQLPPVTEYDENISNDFRKQGNELFTDSERISEAALLYTKAIYSASANSTDLALAHANRAAAIYKLGDYEAAYFDCECALKLGHPKPDVILLRQATCAAALNDTIKLESCINELQNYNLKNRQSHMGDLNRSLKRMKTTSLLPSLTQTQPSPLGEKKQKIMQDAKRGRFVVAGEPIAQNEMIMAEEAFAFVPIRNDLYSILPNTGQHCLNFTCNNCAENDIVPFPCYSCQNVSYCSPLCRDKHSVIHGYECNGYKVDLFLQVGIVHLALRCLLLVFNELLEEVAKKEKGKKNLKQAEALWTALLETGCDGDLMGLCTNYKPMQKDEDLVRYALTASMLCCYLSHKTDFFQHTKKARIALMDSEFEWEIVVTALLLRLTNQMICNAHTIEGIVIQKPFMLPTFKGGELSSAICEGSLFSAIYPRVSLYNHSCKSNFRNKFNKAKLLAIAKVKIDLGEEIFNCYGIGCRSMTRIERQVALEYQYGFRCNCECCQDETDEAYLNNHYKVCKIPTCQTRYLVEQRNTCPKCDTPFDETEYDNFLISIDRLEDSLEQYDNIYNSFVLMKNMFPPYTRSRMQVIASILRQFLKCGSEKLICNSNIVLKMLSLAVDLLETTEKIYGIYDLMFIQNSSYLLDIIVLRKEGNHECISIDYELEKVKKAYDDVITGRLKLKFDLFFDKYIK